MNITCRGQRERAPLTGIVGGPARFTGTSWIRVVSNLAAFFSAIWRSDGQAGRLSRAGHVTAAAAAAAAAALPAAVQPLPALALGRLKLIG